MGDWEHPYLTLDPRYEAGILDVLADLLEEGYVVRQLKPIHWCMTDRTALAEAELEYQRGDHAQHLRQFPDGLGRARRAGACDGPWHAMIWTTTPWTLPANVAIAVHPDLDYAGVRYVDPATGQTVHDDPRGRAGRQGDGLAADHRVRRGRPVPRAGSSSIPNIATRSSTASARSCWPITSASRTAPGWSTPRPATVPKTTRPAGPIDLSILSPVDESGRFTAEAPDWLDRPAGLRGQPGDRRSARRSRAISTTSSRSSHSYPHCWRCKKPVIFRATEQWFIAVDHNDLRGRTLEGDRRGPLAARVGPDADRGDGLAAARLVHQPPAVLGRADPGARLHGLPCPAPHGRDRPPFPRPLPRARGRRLVHAAGRGAGPARRRVPAVRRDVVPQGGRHPRRLVRVRLEPPRRAGEGLRPGLSRPSCIWKAPTSTAAGSSRRS